MSFFELAIIYPNPELIIIATMPSMNMQARIASIYPLSASSSLFAPVVGQM